MKVSIEDIAVAAEAAAERISELIRVTPLEYSPYFSHETGAEGYLKLENFQHTG